MTLSETIRAIRKRRGETMVQFGERLGTDNSVISKYEAAKVMPSRSMLLLLLPLAEGEERRPILDALGLEESDTAGLDQATVQTALESFEAYLKAGGTGRGSKDRNRQAFADLARQVIELRHFEPALNGILEKWIQFGHLKEARQFFKNLDVYLDVELARFSDRERRG